MKRLYLLSEGEDSMEKFIADMTIFTTEEHESSELALVIAPYGEFYLIKGFSKENFEIELVKEYIRRKSERGEDFSELINFYVKYDEDTSSNGMIGFTKINVCVNKEMPSSLNVLSGFDRRERLSNKFINSVVVKNTTGDRVWGHSINQLKRYSTGANFDVDLLKFIKGYTHINENLLREVRIVQGLIIERLWYSYTGSDRKEYFRHKVYKSCAIPLVELWKTFSYPDWNKLVADVVTIAEETISSLKKAGVFLDYSSLNDFVGQLKDLKSFKENMYSLTNQFEKWNAFWNEHLIDFSEVKWRTSSSEGGMPSNVSEWLHSFYNGILGIEEYGILASGLESVIVEHIMNSSFNMILMHQFCRRDNMIRRIESSKTRSKSELQELFKNRTGIFEHRNVSDAFRLVSLVVHKDIRERIKSFYREEIKIEIEDLDLRGELLSLVGEIIVAPSFIARNLLDKADSMLHRSQSTEMLTLSLPVLLGWISEIRNAQKRLKRLLLY